MYEGLHFTPSCHHGDVALMLYNTRGPAGTIDGFKCLWWIPYQRSWWAYLNHLDKVFSPWLSTKTQCVYTICNHRYNRLWSSVKFRPKNMNQIKAVNSTLKKKSLWQVYSNKCSIQFPCFLKLATQNVSPIWSAYSLKHTTETGSSGWLHQPNGHLQYSTVQYRIV